MAITKEALQRVSWQEVKQIAEQFSYEKPKDDAWHDDNVLDAIVAIAQANESLVSDPASASPEAIEAVAQPSSAVAAPPPVVAPPARAVASAIVPSQTGVKRPGKYATRTFQRRGTPFCSACGDQHHNDPKGNPICAESRADCPRLTVAGQAEEQGLSVEDIMNA